MANLQAAVVGKNLMGADTTALPIQEAASLNIPAGMFVKVTSGQAVATTSNDAAQLLGIATGPSANVGSGMPDIPIIPFTPNTVIIMNMTTGGSTVNLAQADLFARYGYIVVGSGQAAQVYVDKAQTGANARLIVVRLIDPVGEPFGRVGVIIARDFRLLAEASNAA